MSVYQSIKLSFLTLSLLIGSINVQAQGASDYVTKEFIDEIFEGGNAGYMDFFKENLDFPKISYQDQIEGLLLFNFTIDGQKEDISIQFLTKLDDRIEASVRSTVQATRSKWNIPPNKKYTIYQPIVFSLLPYYPETLEGDLPELPVALPLKFQQLFIMIKSKRIPKDFDINDLSEEEVSERAKTMYQRTQQAYEKSLVAENFETAYVLLNKLIRYNPLKKEFLLKRIELEQKLEVNDYQVYDAMLLNDFVATAKPLDSYDTHSPFLGRAEETSPDFSRTLNTMELAYVEGYIEFITDLSINYRLPYGQALMGTKGVLLIELKNNGGGQIKSRLLTSFGSPVSKGLENALKGLSENWRTVNGPFHKIFPIYLSQEDEVSNELALLIPDYSLLKTDLFLDPTEYSGTGSSRIVRQMQDISSTERDKLRGQSQLYAVYEAALKEYENQVAEGKPKKAAQALSKAIQLNPFSIELLEKRLALDDKKTRAKFATYDEALLAILKSIKK